MNKETKALKEGLLHHIKSQRKKKETIHQEARVKAEHCLGKIDAFELILTSEIFHDEEPVASPPPERTDM